ncbi:hypothetical protein [Geminocystis sp. GBBB08]|uniref:hypothetical protein n=1 Tax=Geminocystis sp. GBBB08 TaxID=2604140 RepID=UPI0027E261E0|nr:hypothetical protein [Geminocystis sp. GBBB08]MBL1208277.1 hypothetical protein [Geminocystis sp. GBBB08]
MSIYNMIEIFGTISNVTELLAFCQSHKYLMQNTVSKYAQGRKELWIKNKCDLRQQVTITVGFNHPQLNELGHKLLPNFDIGLLLFYPANTQIKLHRDHSLFSNIGVGINLSPSTFLITHDINIKPKEIELKTGYCYRFNTKLLHGIKPVKYPRYAIYFWHFK